jgi:hypothetical protein
LIIFLPWKVFQQQQKRYSKVATIPKQNHFSFLQRLCLDLISSIRKYYWILYKNIKLHLSTLGLILISLKLNLLYICFIFLSGNTIFSRWKPWLYLSPISYFWSYLFQFRNWPD